MALLEVNDLHTSFFTPAGEVRAVNGISFNLDHGKVLGIVGESGSGKSVTAYSIMQILANTGKIVSGSIKLNGQELVGAGEKVMKTVRGIDKNICANVDFYSGLVYKTLDIPVELFTPLFAAARIAGWIAHRIEEVSGNARIIRPAYRVVYDPRPYVDIKDRT